MAEPVSGRYGEEQVKRTGQAALEQISGLALAALARANAELTLADGLEDWEAWSLWRGYRKALLEVLAVTDRLALPPADEATRMETPEIAFCPPASQSQSTGLAAPAL